MQNSYQIQFNANINFKLLKEQKQTLLKLAGNPNFTYDETRHLDGVIQLIDAIQDCAVDEHNVPKSLVFITEK